jgi:hypothetical protein
MKLWKNGHFYSLRNPNEVFYNVVTHDGLIVDINAKEDPLLYDEIIDMKGCYVYPGFVDAHMHLLGYGQMLSRPKLFQIKSKEEVITIIKAHFRNEPLFAEGYFECGLTKDDLNQISSTYPIYIRHNDYHSITVNDVVLKKMKLMHDTGVLTEELAVKAMDTYPKYDDEGLDYILKLSIESLYRYGITGAHSDDLYYFNGFKDTVKSFERVLKTHPFRAHLLMHHETIDDFMASGRPFLDQSPYLQLGAVKMFYDGTLSSKTAYMSMKYKDQDQHGIIVNTKEGFIQLVKKARSFGLPVAIHVIGDQGFDEVLDILEAYPPKKGMLDRLIHTPWVKASTLKRLKNIKLTTDIQPQFLSSDLPWALSYLSKEPDYIFPWKSLLNTGINLAGSSDAPVEIPNPLLGIYAATKRVSDHDHKVYQPHEALTPFEAITLYTKGANYNAEHTNRGYIDIGFIADFSVFKNDLLNTDLERYKEDLVYMTVIDEKIVFRSLK